MPAKDHQLENQQLIIAETYQAFFLAPFPTFLVIELAQRHLHLMKLMMHGKGLRMVLMPQVLDGDHHLCPRPHRPQWQKPPRVHHQALELLDGSTMDFECCRQILFGSQTSLKGRHFVPFFAYSGAQFPPVHSQA